MNFSNKRFDVTLFVLLLSLLAPRSVVAATTSGAENKNTATNTPTTTTHGLVTIEGKRVSYTAVAGTLTLRNKKKELTARMFYVAYFKAQDSSAHPRPITFFYNGGPGSSTVWLHMAAFGPRRAVTTDHAHTPPAPYKLVDNQYSLLDATDLVFIDAPSTGYSRIITKKDGGAGDGKRFYGIDEDAAAFGQFIVAFLSKYHRWNSPKYLFGESYGTTRSVVLGKILQQKYNIDLNGIVLLSAILNFSTSTDEARFTPGIDLPYELALPTYAAAAWYHHKLSDRYSHLEPLLKTVENFAMTDYAQALLAGSTLSDTRRRNIAGMLHQYTGLPTDYLLKIDLRVRAVEFEKELFRDSDQAMGRLDSRYVGPAMDPLSETTKYDPTGAAMKSAIVSLFNQYVHQNLHYDTDLRYRSGYPPVRDDWDWQHQPAGFGKHTRVIPNVMIDLAREMKYNPKLEIMLNAGYFDLATPFYAAVFVMHHLQIPARLEKNISFHFYRSGHMVYLHIPSLVKLHDNVARFISETSVAS